MKEDLHTYIDESEMAGYYGCFEKKPQNFKFMPGDKKMLSHLADTCKKLVSANLKRTLVLSSGLERKRSKSSTPKPSKSDNFETVDVDDADEDNENNNNLVKKVESLVNHVKDYINKNLKNLANLSLSMQDVTQDAHGVFHAKAICPVKTCNFTIIINTNKHGSWATSNFYTHLRTHAKLDQTDSTLDRFLSEESLSKDEGDNQELVDGENFQKGRKSEKRDENSSSKLDSLNGPAQTSADQSEEKEN